MSLRSAGVLLMIFGVVAAVRAQNAPVPVQFPDTTQTSMTDCAAPVTLTLEGGGTVTFRGGQFVHYSGVNFYGTMYSTSSAAGCQRMPPDYDPYLGQPLSEVVATFSQPISSATVTPYNLLPYWPLWQFVTVTLWDASGNPVGEPIGESFPPWVTMGYPLRYPPPGAAWSPFTVMSFRSDLWDPTSGLLPDWDWGIAALAVRQNPSYVATGQILDGSPVETKTGVTPDHPVYAQVPLGLELRLGIQKNGVYISARFDLSRATLTGLADPTLYPNNAVLEYNRNLREGQKTFRAVHIGTQKLTITPDDTSIHPFSFTLGVIDPGTLGDTDNDYDSAIVNWGNQRGIPPHILKGLIKQESGGFNPNEYRYEPLNPETGDIGITVNYDNLQDDPYEHYRMATAARTDTTPPTPALPKGDLLLDFNSGLTYTSGDDISPRQHLKVPRGPTNTLIDLRPIDVCPSACVSAKEIILANDSNPQNPNNQNWTNHADFDINDPADLARVAFTAQTTIAASYGLMQIMYATAIDTNWHTIDGRQNPSLLFDTPANWNIGGGSLAAGTRNFYKCYRSDNVRAGDWATNPDFTSSDDYEEMIIRTLNYYNGDSSTNANYGDNAWGYSLQYSPGHSSSRIFP